MPDETLITQIENLLSEVIRLGGENERTQIVPNLTVQNAAPTGLSGFIIVSDDRDGDNILAKKVPGVIYSNNDLVNIMFVKGGEAIAFQQGSGSTTSGLWDIVVGTDDIYYNKGDVGIGKSVAPDAALEVLSNSQSQLRITHTEDTKFVSLTLDTNHDLTIKPSSTGQVIFQPTSDSTDFFQVLDADGGTPVLNIDSTNERLGIGTATPGNTLDVAGSIVLSGGSRNITQDADNVILRVAAGTDELSGGAMIFRGRDRATLPGQCIFNYGGYNNIGSVSFRQINTAGTPTGTLTIEADGDVIVEIGDVGITVDTPQGRIHGYDQISGFLHWEYDGLDGTSRTIIPNGSGDVLYELFGMYVLRDSSGNTASATFTVTNGGSTGLAVGANTVTVAVAAAGTTTVSRTAGADTIKVTFWLLWL